MKRLVNVFSVMASLISFAVIVNALMATYEGAWANAIAMTLLCEGFILALNYIFFKKATLWNSGG